jgi:hypothetical protein
MFHMRKVISATLAAAILLAAVTVAAADERSARAQESRSQESRSQELIEQARAALGGDKLKSIQSLSLSGKYRRIVQPEMPEMAGEMEIDLLLPDKYLKTETMNLPVGDGYITRIDGINGDQVFRDSKTSGGAGMVIIRRPGSDDPQGQAAEARALRAEFVRNLLSFILAAPPSFPVEFSYAGEAEAEDGRADVIDVKGTDGFAARLFLDKQSHRLLMLSYRARQPRVGMMTRRIEGANREEAEKAAREAEKNSHAQAQEAKEVEVQVYFSEYQSVDGVSLPHQIARSIDGKVSEEWEIKKFKINPPLKAEKFKKQ